MQFSLPSGSPLQMSFSHVTAHRKKKRFQLQRLYRVEGEFWHRLRYRMAVMITGFVCINI
jgi:hypothetical protein